MRVLPSADMYAFLNVAATLLLAQCKCIWHSSSNPPAALVREATTRFESPLWLNFQPSKPQRDHRVDANVRH